MIIIKLIILIILAYFVGAIPTGVIISRRFFGFDIRTKGSGNMGSTNTMRVLGTRWGVLVQVLDILKGTLAVLLVADLLGNNWGIVGNYEITPTILEIIVGVSAVLGHIFSCFVKFKGGKGVNTTLGMFIAILPIELLVGLLSFVLVVGISGFVSLGSMIGASMIPVVLCIRYNIFNVKISDYLTLMYFVVGLALVLIIAHRSNIVKLAKRTENKMEKMAFISNCCIKNAIKKQQNSV